MCIASSAQYKTVSCKVQRHVDSEHFPEAAADRYVKRLCCSPLVGTDSCISLCVKTSLQRLHAL